MSTNEVRSNDAARNAGVAGIDMKLEVVVIPVADVERSKEFYEGIGWRFNFDRSTGEDFRLVQFTPPGSGCSVHFGKNVTSAANRSFRYRWVPLPLLGLEHSIKIRRPLKERPFGKARLLRNENGFVWIGGEGGCRSCSVSHREDYAKARVPFHHAAIGFRSAFEGHGLNHRRYGRENAELQRRIGRRWQSGQ